MRKFLLLTLIAVITSAPVYAQRDKAQHESWMREMTRYKHEFLIKELNLNAEQQKAFFPIYDAMENECRRLVDQTRELEQSVLKKGDEASDVEREKAAEAVFEVKGKESAIEMKYFAKFKTVLNSRQLLKLCSAERKFKRQVLKEHRKHMKGAPKPRK